MWRTEAYVSELVLFFPHMILGIELRSPGLAAEAPLPAVLSGFLPFKTFFVTFYLLSYWAWEPSMCHYAHVKVRGQFPGVSSLLPP